MVRRVLIGAASKPPVPPPHPGQASMPGPTAANTSVIAPATATPPVSAANICPPITTVTPAAVSAPAPPRQGVLNFTDTFICSVLYTSVGILLSYVPLLHNLMNGNIGETIALWNPKGIQVGLANNLVWICYGVIKLAKDKTLDMILGNSFGAAASVGYLLVIYAYKRQIKRACFTVGFVILCTIGSLLLYQIEMTDAQNNFFEQVFGYGGNVLLIAVHFIQTVDLIKATEQRELLSAGVSVFPNLVFTAVQCFISFLLHRDQKFIMASCYINIIFYPTEAFLILKMHFLIKTESKKVLLRIQSSFLRRRDSSLTRSNTSDLEAGQNERFPEEAARTQLGDIELTERIRNDGGRQVEATMQPESDDYESALEDMDEEEFPARIAGAGDEGTGHAEFSVITVGRVLTQHVIVDPSEVQRSISVLYPWETQNELNLPNFDMGRDDSDLGRNAQANQGNSEIQGQGFARVDSPVMRKRKKKTSSLAELTGIGGDRPWKKLRSGKISALEGQPAPRRTRKLIPSCISFGCKE